MRYKKIRFETDQVRPSSTIEHSQAWKILDTEFRNQRKLMDELLKEITNLKPVKSDSTSLSRYAATILRFVNKMEQNGCAVTNASEAPFFMSQLLSKLDAKHNVQFGRERHRIKKKENVLNLIDWLNSEASLRSQVKTDSDCHSNTGDRQLQFSRKSHNHAANSEKPNHDLCLLGCAAKQLLSNFPIVSKSNS